MVLGFLVYFESELLKRAHKNFDFRNGRYAGEFTPVLVFSHNCSPWIVLGTISWQLLRDSSALFPQQYSFSLLSQIARS